jgi:RNA-binding protein
MSELPLTRDERLALRARAHHLNPIVLLGAAGLTEAIFKETDRALAAHELIKVRIPGDDRDAREAICALLAERLGAARVQVIGKLLVLYRPRPEVEAKASAGTVPHRARAAAPRGEARQAAAARRPARPAPRASPRRGSGR